MVKVTITTVEVPGEPPGCRHGLAGEKLEAGDFVTLSPDGRVYRSTYAKVNVALCGAEPGWPVAYAARGHVEGLGGHPSGVRFIEADAPHVVTPPSASRCAVCGQPSAEPIPAIGWGRKDGWEVVWPRCPHGKYVLCPECRGKDGCPACGCREEYT